MQIIDEIIEVKREEIKLLHRDYSYSRFQDSRFFEVEKLSLFDSLKSESEITVIAEIKKASPSKGVIREDFNHIKIAEEYMKAGANAISVLTDVKFFQGDINYLKEIALLKECPILRKDFILDEFQIYEAKSNGADAVLLICECLSRNQIAELSQCAQETGLEVLLELHSSEQIFKIDFNLNKIIGINNRDLTNFVTSLETTEIIKKLIPDKNLIVSESGINDRKDIDFLLNLGINSVLVGEFFMKEKSIYDGLKLFKDWCQIES